MAVELVDVHRGAYADSVQLMAATRGMGEQEGVAWAAALMGTPANLEALAAQGFADAGLSEATAADIVIAVRAQSGDQARQALEAAGTTLAGPAVAGARPETEPRSLEDAVRLMPDANIALISVAGPYAAIEAHKALSLGLHTLLFSDNVPVADEVGLKRRASDLGLLLMGPGAGTSYLGGTGLGFSNAVRRGPVGLVAGAGTGAQEIMTLVHRWGSGLSNVIGIGGRDLHDEVGGLMADLALRALLDDEETKVIVLVAKPPSPKVAASLLARLGAKPTVAIFVGLPEDSPTPEGVLLAGSMEEAASVAVSRLGLTPPATEHGLAAAATAAAARLKPQQHAIRGLFSGGTLCAESMALTSKRLGPVYSNAPLRPEWGLPGPADAHRCLDLGEEEFTSGRPHPMIDAAARIEHIERAADDPATAVILLDVVLGYGSHPDPASVLGPACERAARSGQGPVVVAYVLGTEGDPQHRQRQEQVLADAGCILAPTGARAALLAAAIAARRPQITEETP
jgi:FdrA protein